MSLFGSVTKALGLGGGGSHSYDTGNAERVKAMEELKKASKENIADIRQARDVNTPQYKNYLQTLKDRYNTQLSGGDLTKEVTPQDVQAYLNNPMWKTMMGKRQDALQSSLVGGGMLRSGKGIKDLANLSDNEFMQAYNLANQQKSTHVGDTNRLNTGYEHAYNPLSEISFKDNYMNQINQARLGQGQASANLYQQIAQNKMADAKRREQEDRESSSAFGSLIGMGSKAIMPFLV